MWRKENWDHKGTYGIGLIRQGCVRLAECPIEKSGNHIIRLEAFAGLITVQQPEKAQANDREDTHVKP